MSAAGPSQQPAGGGSAPEPPAPELLTTAGIQKMLEENAVLIRAITENQNQANLKQCLTYQAKLQKNLLMLAQLADRQAQPKKP